MRRTQMLLLIGGLVMLIVGIGVGFAGRATAVERERLALAQQAAQQAQVVDEYVARAKAIISITAHNPAFAAFADAPGSRATKLVTERQAVEEANAALRYLETLYPTSIGEACFIDADGAEIARMVRGERATVADLSLEEAKAPFFAPTFKLPAGAVHHAKPYVSPDTDEWVIANSTLVPTAPGAKQAIVHFEVTIESFRRHAERQGAHQLLVVDGDTGAVVINTERPQRIGAPLGDPADNRFTTISSGWRESGQFSVDGRPGAYQRIAWSATNTNHWYAVALAPAAVTALTGVGSAAIVLVVLALLLIGYATVGLRRGQSLLMAAANTDPLTGLHNRRRLVTDIARHLRRASASRPLLLIMCDLNGFKVYNDTFGHPAGDALLARLGAALATAVAGQGVAYRLGGDEFCVLAQGGHYSADELVRTVVEALTEHGDGFAITTAFGVIVLPDECQDADEAMRLVDIRLYEQKNSGRVPADAQTTRALLRVLSERDPDLAERMDRTADLACAVADAVGLSSAEQRLIGQAARLHDIGKMAVPDQILLKPGPLNDAERAFVQQSPVIGERITAAAPSLATLAPLIRSARERFDGMGYPDRLAGQAIPYGSRIIAACAALVAMISERPYGPALSMKQAIEQLHHGRGNQFDPQVVAALGQYLAERPLNTMGATAQR